MDDQEGEREATGGARSKTKSKLTKADLENLVSEREARIADLERRLANRAEGERAAPAPPDEGTFQEFITRQVTSSNKILDSLSTVVSQLATRQQNSGGRVSYRGPREPEKLDLDSMKSKSVELWVKNFRSYMTLSGLENQDEELQILALKSACTYPTLLKLESFSVPDTEDIESWLAAILGFAKKEVSALVERQILAKRKQLAGESVKEYFLALKVLSTDCKFASDDRLSLKDVFVNGIKSEFLRQHIFMLPDLDEMSMEDFITVVSKLEAAENYNDKFVAKDFSASSQDVNAVRTNYKKQKQGQAGDKSTGDDRKSTCGRCKLKNCRGNPCNTVCFKCKQKGHSKGTCRAKAKQSANTVSTAQHQAEKQEADQCSDSEPRVGHISTSAQHPIFGSLDGINVAGITINNVTADKDKLKLITVRFFSSEVSQLVQVLPDSGAAVSCMPERLARKLKCIIVDCGIRVKNADASACSVVGETQCTIRFNNSTIYDHKFIVLKEGNTLLSKGACIDIGLLPANFPLCFVSGAVSTSSEDSSDSSSSDDTSSSSSDSSSESDRDWRRREDEKKQRKATRKVVMVDTPEKIAMIDTPNNISSVKAQLGNIPNNPSKSDVQLIFDRIVALFSDVVVEGKTPPMKGDDFVIHVREGAKPFAVKTPRPVPIAYWERLKTEIQCLVREGVIEPVTEPTDWVSPIVVVPRKGSERVRLCVDYTQLNRAIDRAFYYSPSPSVSVADIPSENARWFAKLDCLLGFHQVPIARV